MIRPIKLENAVADTGNQVYLFCQAWNCENE